MPKSKYGTPEYDLEKIQDSISKLFDKVKKLRSETGEIELVLDGDFISEYHARAEGY